MKTKLLYILALTLTFASTQATSTHSTRTIKTVFIEQPNGDYRIYLFGSGKSLVCEEKNITIVSQGDAVNPVVLSCDHTK